jgi:endoglucanase Acf2
MVERLIGDAANWSREDKSFPVLRYMDVYAGHSWANGPAQFEEGNNEEASSEELNFSNACLLWGALTRNREVRDLGAFLASQQVAAVEQYWFDVDRQVFPKTFQHPVAAMVWGAGAKYDTWFDQDPTVIHGINFLPFTGASLYLGRHPKFVEGSFDLLLKRSHGQITTWRDYIFMFLATADAARAEELFERDPHFEPEFGNSMAFTLHWLQAWKDLGHFDTQTTADVATAAVFIKDGRRTHSAFNPDEKLRVVTFSDGKVLRVGPRSLASD